MLTIKTKRRKEKALKIIKKLGVDVKKEMAKIEESDK